MNTKTTKLLAVLAVLAVAFAVFAVIAPSEQNDADPSYTPEELVVDTEITATAAAYLVLDDIKVTLTGITAGDVTTYFLVSTGKTLNLVTPAVTGATNNVVIVSTEMTEAPGAAIDLATKTDGKVTINDLAKKVDISYTAGTYSNVFKNDAKISGTSPLAIAGTNGQVAVDGTLTLTGDTIAATNISYALSVQECTDSTWGTQKSIVYYSTADRTLELSKKNMVISLLKGDLTVKNTYNDRGTDKSVTIAFAGANETATAYTIKLKNADGINCAPQIAGNGNGSATISISGNTGIVAVANGTTLKAKMVDAWAYSDNGGTGATINGLSATLVTIAGGTYNTVLMSNPLSYSDTNDNGKVKGKIYAIGAVTGSFGITSAAQIMVGAYSKATATISYTYDSETAKIDLVKFRVNNECTISGEGASAQLNIASTTGAVATLNGELDIVSGTVNLAPANNKGVIIGKDTSNPGVLYVKTGAVLLLPNVVTNTFGDTEFKVYGTMKVAGEIKPVAGVGPVYVHVYGDKVNETTSQRYSATFKAMQGAIFTHVIVNGGAAAEPAGEDPNYTGTINLTDGMSTKTLTGTTVDPDTYSQLQTVVIDDNFKARSSNALITIYGSLVVKEGATLSLVEGAKIVVSGSTTTVDIAGSVDIGKTTGMYIDKSTSVKISGTVASEGDLYINSQDTSIAKGGKIVSEGKFLVGSEGATIAAGGTLDIRGDFNINKMKNSGTVIFNEANLIAFADIDMDAPALAKHANALTTVTAASTINMYANGAEVKFVTLYFANEGNTITLTDKDCKTTSKYTQMYGSEVTISSKTGSYHYNGNGIAGLVVSEVITESNDVIKQTYPQMVLSGTIVYTTSVTPVTAYQQESDEIIVTTATAEGYTYSNLAVTDALVVTEQVKFLSTGDMTVSGVMTVKKDATLAADGTGKVTVTGYIYQASNTVTIGGNLNAATYKNVEDGETTMVYTNLNDAVEDNSDAAEQVNVTVYGEVDVDSNLEIPAVVKIKLGVAGSAINVGSMLDNVTTMVLKAGSDIANGFTVTVYGTFFVEDYKNLKSTDIISDVKVVNGITVKYTNLISAIGTASAGDEIEANGNVVIRSDLTIPAGVTVVITDDATIAINDNVVLTVAGTLKTEKVINGDFATKADADHAAIVVTGTLMSSKALDDYNYKIPGAYYTDSTGDYNCVSPLPVAVEKASSMEVYGNNSVGDVTIKGTSSKQKTVKILPNGSLDADNLALEYAKVTMDGPFTGTISDANAAVKFANVTGLTVTSKDAYALSGTVADADINAYVTFVSGVVSVLDTCNLSDDDVATTMTATADIYVANTSSSNGVLTLPDEFEIAGDVLVANGGKIVSDSKVYITGTLTVAPADVTAGTAAGSASLYEVIVGVGPKDLKWDDTVGSAAAVNASSLGTGLRYVAVVAGSTVSDEIVDGMRSSAFNVEGKLWMTVYAANNSVLIEEFQFPVLENVKIAGWYYDKDGTQTPADSLSVTGGYTVYAKILKNIYYVEIYTDAGIKAVSIDGIEMFNYESNLFVTISPIEAGTHKVTYTLKNGYEETQSGVALYTADGTILKSLSFVTSGIDDEDLTVQLLLNGTEQIIAPEPTPVEQNEWTITTILLVILVILIAVMAVIVALRLNRS